MKSRLRSSLLVYSCLLALACILALLPASLNPMALADLWRYDSLVKKSASAMKGDPEKSLLLIAIDEDSIAPKKEARDPLARKGYGKWPWPRSLHARLIRKLDHLGARVIAFDAYFTSPTIEEQDREMVAAVKESQKVVLGAILRKEGDGGEATQGSSLLLKYFPGLEELEGEKFHSGVVIVNQSPLDRKVRSTFLFLPSKLVLDTGKSEARAIKSGPGESEIILKEGELPERNPGRTKRVSWGGDFYFAYQIVRSFLGIHDPPRLGPEFLGFSLMDDGTFKIPLENEEMLIPFSGGPGYMERKGQQVSYWRVLEPDFPAERVRGKIALVFPTFDPHDQYLVPTSRREGDVMNGGEIHAHIIQALLQKRFILHWPLLDLVLAVPLLAVGLLILSLTHQWKVRSLLYLLLFLITFVVQQAFFSHQRLWLKLAPSLAPLALGFLGSMAYENERLKLLFSKFIPTTVIERMLAGSKTLFRKKQEVSVLFSDIRGYTTLSEKMDPEKVMDLLNRYHTEMAKIFAVFGGVIMDYQGDAQMVAFGTEKGESNHALAAVSAAIEMQDMLCSLNEGWEQDGLTMSGGKFQPIEIGIGICTGRAAVGMVGADQKLQYTVIGDIVNTAARLQALSRQLSAPILISRETAQALKGSIPCEALPPMMLKGKTVAVEVFKVKGWDQE